MDFSFDWTGLKGKNVRIVSKQGRITTGYVKDVITSDFEYTLYIIDKFGKAVMIINSSIAELREE